MGGVAFALVLGITLQIVSNDSAKCPLEAAHMTASNPDCTGVILENALHPAPFDRKTECLAVFEAVREFPVCPYTRVQGNYYGICGGSNSQ
jgi:hypothetical protein